MTRIVAVLALALAACASPTAPSDATPVTPPAPGAAGAVAAVAGAWVDTTDAAGDGLRLVMTQRGDSVQATEDTYLRVGNPGATWWVRTGTTMHGGGTVTGDTLVAMAGTDTLVLSADGRALANPPADSVALADPEVFTRGAWAPDTTPQTPAPPTVRLNGVYMSDSVDWTATGEPCFATVQIALVIDSAGPGYPQAPPGGYMSTEYDRQCGSTWAAALANWVVIDSGHVTGGMLALSEALLTDGYTGPFTPAGSNWQLAVITNDSLADVTAPATNRGWLPAAFVHQPNGFGASARRPGGAP